MVFFVVSAGHKCLSFSKFSGIVRAYAADRISLSAASVVAGLVILTEVAVAATCMVKYGDITPVIFIVALLAGYAALIAVNLIAGRASLDCGCSWSAQKSVISYRLVLRNLVLIGMAATLLVEPADRLLFVFDYFAGVMFTSVLLLAYLFQESLFSNHDARREAF